MPDIKCEHGHAMRISTNQWVETLTPGPVAVRPRPGGSPYLLLTDNGKRVTAPMLRHRWDDAREAAVKEAVAAGDQVLAGRISQFQFRDIRPKAASEITDVDHASLLLGHTKGDITERVYRRIGALAKPTK